MSDAPAEALEVAMPSHPKFLPMLRALAEECAALAGFEPADRERISLGVTEGVSNVIRHSYGGDTSGRIDLRLQAPPGVFRIEIRDYGRFVDPARIQSRPLEEVRPGGLGVHLMKATMDRVEYARNEQGGTTLTMVKRVGCSRPDEATS